MGFNSGFKGLTKYLSRLKYQIKEQRGTF